MAETTPRASGPGVAERWRTWFPDDALGSLVGGRIEPGEGSAVPLVDPASGRELARYADGGVAAVDHAVQAAVGAGCRWRALTASQRGRVMFAVGAMVREHAEDLAYLEAQMAGKPVRDARAEVAKVAEMFEYYAGWADKQHGEVIPVPSGHLNYTLREPYGVVAQMTPWNAPVFTAGWQIAPAIAAGNAVVLKPSELTPLTSIVLGHLIEQAGAPRGLVNVVAGLGPTAGNRLVTHPDIGKVVFVGSPATGRAIAAEAGRHLKPCVLELGGKSANIVFDDADLPRAVGGAAAAVFSAAGQSCVAGSRLMIQRGVYDEVIERLSLLTARIVVGDPLQETTQVGPLQNARQLEHVSTLVQGALTGGARAVCGGAPLKDAGFFYPPTVLGDVGNDDPIARTEVFGPVVAAIPFDDEEDAVRMANDTEFGLAGAVWTSRADRGHRVAHALRAGTVWVNSYKTINVMSPFGGFGASGFGRSSGRDGLWEYTQAKSIWHEITEHGPLTFGY